MLKMVRDWEMGAPRARSFDTTKTNQQPLKVTLDGDETRWWVKVNFAYETYKPHKCRRFTNKLRDVVEELASTPLEIV